MVEVCGVKYLEGKSKRTGKDYEAYILFYTEDGKPQGVTGFVTGDVFVSVDILDGRVPSVGDRVTLFYDKRGFLTDIKFEG